MNDIDIPKRRVRMGRRGDGQGVDHHDDDGDDYFDLHDAEVANDVRTQRADIRLIFLA